MNTLCFKGDETAMSFTMDDIKCKNYKNCDFCNLCLTNIDMKKKRCFKERKEMTTKEELLRQQEEISKQLAEIEEEEKRQAEEKRKAQQTEKENQLNNLENAIEAFNNQWGTHYMLGCYTVPKFFNLSDIF